MTERLADTDDGTIVECSRYIHERETSAYVAAGWTVTPLPPHAPFCLAARPAPATPEAA